MPEGMGGMRLLSGSNRETGEEKKCHIWKMVLILVTEPQLLGLNLKGMDMGCHDLSVEPGKVVQVEWKLPMAPLL